MKAYFIVTDGNNFVALTDGATVKMYDGAPDGSYEGIDLYADAESVVDELKKLFDGMQASGMNDYQDIWCEDETEYDNNIFESKNEHEVYYIGKYE